MEQPLYIAVDLGAGSGRVFLAVVSAEEWRLEEIRRFQYPPARRAGHLCWDLTHIFAEIKAGLREAGVRARALGRRVESIGVDSWGVDYGLIDADGALCEDPICYRDERTTGVMDEVFARVPRAEIFARTGIQFLNFNTIYQLFAHARAGLPGNAARLLLMPDLIQFLLTGRAVAEYTNATTMQLVHAETRAWDASLLERLGLPAHLLAEIVPAGTPLGGLRPALEAELDLPGVRVVAPATHDTGSAVAGAPLDPGMVYISSGTWSLVGIERDRILINPDVARENFTNEGGAFGTIRFLKNVMGLWILESCRREWQAQGLPVEYDELLREAAAHDDAPALFFPDDERLFNPPCMLDAIAAQLAETGQPVPAAPPAMTRAILDSLALRYASVIERIESLAGESVRSLRIVGGGSRNRYLNQATASATGKPVFTGPVEATVIGNVLVQAVAARRFASLADARRQIVSHVDMDRYEPRNAPAWADARARYRAIEARFAN